MTITLSNPSLKLTVNPDEGARIDELIDLKTQKDWMWRAPNFKSDCRHLPLGSSFDDHWIGGWDDIFPNDAAGSFNGRELVDHGELWGQPWKILEQSPTRIRLSYLCKRVPVTVIKSIHLDSVNREFWMNYLFTQSSAEQIPFLFKMHPAIAIEPGDEILLPPCQIEPVELGFSTLIGKPGKTLFPKAYSRSGSEIRLDRTLPLETPAQEFYYATQLQEGRCGVYNPRTQSRFQIEFDLKQTPYTWVFQSYGQWKNHYVLMLEPCTNIPYDLETALRNQTCAILKPFGSQEFQFHVKIE
jgi:hypothetical protein